LKFHPDSLHETNEFAQRLDAAWVGVQTIATLMNFSAHLLMHLRLTESEKKPERDAQIKRGSWIGEGG
jgi:hypothetical protein